MQLMFSGQNYKIYANPERKLYELVNNDSLMVEAEDRVLPKLLIALREYDRVIGTSEQEKEKKGAVIPILVR